MGKESIIQAAAEQDAEAIREIYAPYVATTAISFEYEVPSVEEMRRRIHHTLKQYPFLVAKEKGEILGYAYAGAFHERAAYAWAAETSIYIKAEKKRAGTGRRLYDALEAALKAQGILNLNACIAYLANEDAHLTGDSVAFHEKMGYRMVGRFHACGYKFGRWYDMVWMEKEIGLHPANPGKVKPFEEVRQKLEIF